MADSREVFKAKMEQGRKDAAAKRQAQLEASQQAALERAVDERLAEIQAQEAAYGGYSELSKPAMPPKRDLSRERNGESHYDSVQNLSRGGRESEAGIPPPSSAASAAGARDGVAAVVCHLCKGFPWHNVPINIARDRFKWLCDEVARIAGVMSSRESEFSHKRGCSICGGRPAIPDHWYHVKTTIDRSTGVEYTLYACSQPCYVDLPRKYPKLFGLMVANPSP